MVPPSSPGDLAQVWTWEGFGVSDGAVSSRRTEFPTSRRPSPTLPAALVSSLLVGLLAVLAACGSGSHSSSTLPAVSAPSSTAAGSPSTDASPSSSAPPASPSVTPTPYKTTSAAHTEPWKDKNADFGWVSNAKAVSGGVEFSFDRAEWLLPDEVAAWNKANPTHKVTVSDDYAIGNVSTRLRTFVLRTHAQIFGSVILTGNSEPAKITAAQFLAGVDAAGKDGVTCWIYHQYGGLTGDVVQLEEQYRP
jgi:hypothetical protein